MPHCFSFKRAEFLNLVKKMKDEKKANAPSFVGMLDVIKNDAIASFRKDMGECE